MAKKDRDRIRVIVRKRPANAKEQKEGDVLQCVSSQQMNVLRPRVRVDLSEYVEEFPFVFDEVLTETNTNHDVYSAVAPPLLDAVMNGGCGTCFAYGQTGSGKTYTMIGSNSNPGFYALATEDLFNRLQTSTDPQFTNAYIEISFYEIYAGQIFDLLNAKRRLQCRADDKRGIVQLAGLTTRRVNNVREVLEHVALGTATRCTGSTGANSESSRSHAVLNLSIRVPNTAPPAPAARGGGLVPQARPPKDLGQLSVIDLAGNERGADTQACDRQTRLEGADINKSLLALKECIRALAMASSHVPFRGSKLTTVLRNAFVGANNSAAMIACVGPAASSVEHTLNTLRYAERVKDFKHPAALVGVPAVAHGADPSGALQALQDAQPARGGDGGGRRVASPTRLAAGAPAPAPQAGRRRVSEAAVTPYRGPAGGAGGAGAGGGSDALAPRRVGSPQREARGDDDEDYAALAAAQDALLDEQEAVMDAYRANVDVRLDLLNVELDLVEASEAPGYDADAFVANVMRALDAQAAKLAEMRERVAAYRDALSREDIACTVVLKRKG